MSINNLKKLSEKDGSSSIIVHEGAVKPHLGRIAVAIQDHGYACDEDGNPRRVLAGWALNPNLTNSNNEPTWVVIGLKTAEETALERYKPKSGANNSYASLLSSVERQLNKRDSIDKVTADFMPGLNNKVVMCDFPTAKRVRILEDAGNPSAPKGEVHRYNVHYISPLAHDKGTGRSMNAEVFMGSVGFIPSHVNENVEKGIPGKDVFHIKKYISAVNSRFVPPNTAGGKDYQEDIVQFMAKALDHRLDKDETADFDTARRTGFVTLGVHIHDVDASGKPILRKIEDSYSNIYPARAVIGTHHNENTGRSSEVTESIGALPTLTNLVQGKDRDTIKYQENPQNPNLERRVLESDMKRGILHEISGRPPETLIIASQRQENIDKVKEVVEAMRDGRAQLTVTAGERIEFYAKPSQDYADIHRVVYNKAVPDNPSNRNQPATFAHGSFHNLMKYEARPNPDTGEMTMVNKEVVAPMAISTAAIDQNTLARGSYLGQIMTPMSEMGVMYYSDKFDPHNPDPTLLDKYSQTKFTIGVGFPEKRLNQAAKEFLEANPLHKSREEAIAAFQLEQQEEANAKVFAQSEGIALRSITNEPVSTVQATSNADVFANLLKAAGSDNDISAQLKAAQDQANENQMQVQNLVLKLQDDKNDFKELPAPTSEPKQAAPAAAAPSKAVDNTVANDSNAPLPNGKIDEPGNDQPEPTADSPAKRTRRKP